MKSDWRSRWGYIQGMATETILMDHENLPSIFIISHARLDVPTFQAIPELVTLATLVVPQEQYLAYVAAWPNTTIVALPEGLYGVDRGVAQARQACLDMAPSHGLMRRCVILDDDITGIAMMYQGEDGKASSAHVGKVGDKRNLYSFGVFCVAVLTAIEAMNQNPDLVIVGPQNRNDQRTLDAALAKYDLNYGRMPIGFVIWDVDRFRKVAPDGLDMRYNAHGEDLWAAMTVLWNGGSYGRVPSVLVSYYDEHTQSTLKTPENEHLVRAAEWERIQTEPWVDYVRTKWDILDRFAGAAPNLKKFRDSAPFRRVLWTGEVLEKPARSDTPTSPSTRSAAMKVAVYHPFEVTEEQRLQLGAVLTGKTKPKNAAKRDDFKAYFLEHGSKWDAVLAEQHAALVAAEPEDEPDAEAAGDDEDVL
jgi:hypothetical protein